MWLQLKQIRKYGPEEEWSSLLFQNHTPSRVACETILTVSGFRIMIQTWAEFLRVQKVSPPLKNGDYLIAYLPVSPRSAPRDQPRGNGVKLPSLRIDLDVRLRVFCLWSGSLAEEACVLIHTDTQCIPGPEYSAYHVPVCVSRWRPLSTCN